MNRNLTLSPHPDVTFTFYGAQAETRFEGATMAGIDAAGEFLVERIKEKIRTPYPPPSTPGNPPHARTYELHDSVRILGRGPGWIDVGSDSPHADPLELGTVNMEARPFIKPTMLENQQAVLQIIASTATRQAQQTSPSPRAGSFGGQPVTTLRGAVAEGLASLRWFAQTLKAGRTR